MVGRGMADRRPGQRKRLTKRCSRIANSGLSTGRLTSGSDELLADDPECSPALPAGCGCFFGAGVEAFATELGKENPLLATATFTGPVCCAPTALAPAEIVCSSDDKSPVATEIPEAGVSKLSTFSDWSSGVAVIPGTDVFEVDLLAAAVACDDAEVVADFVGVTVMTT